MLDLLSPLELKLSGQFHFLPLLLRSGSLSGHFLSLCLETVVAGLNTGQLRLNADQLGFKLVEFGLRSEDLGFHFGPLCSKFVLKPVHRQFVLPRGHLLVFLHLRSLVQQFLLSRIELLTEVMHLLLLGPNRALELIQPVLFALDVLFQLVVSLLSI